MTESPPSIYPDLERNFTPTSCGSTICSYSKKLPGDSLAVIMIHGYPQSAYEWRYLPGYGVSTSSTSYSKRTIGHAILEAFVSVFNIADSPKTKHPIILLGHDRGARISHRLAVDFAHSPNPSPTFPSPLQLLELKTAILLDILPTRTQWSAFASPSASAGYFHWPFLARTDIAVPMLKAFGGDNFCRQLLTKASGTNEKGRKAMFAGGAEEVYCANFRKEEAIVGTCEDYKDGATDEVELQMRDVEGGRKVRVPVLVMWSERGIGRWGDVEKEWRELVEEGVELKGVGVGEGFGHYLPEEAAEIVGEEVRAWLEKTGIKGFK